MKSPKMSRLWKEYHLSLQSVVDEPTGLFSTEDRHDLEKGCSNDNFIEALLTDQNQNKYANECGTKKMKDRIFSEILSLNARISTTENNHLTQSSVCNAVYRFEPMESREEMLRIQLQNLDKKHNFHHHQKLHHHYMIQHYLQHFQY